jgi:hypothetical protein
VKEIRASFALLFFIIAAHIAHLLPQSGTAREVQQTYSATACPGAIGDARATVLLPNNNAALREVARPQAKLRKNGQGNYLVNNGALYLEGSASNNIEIQTRANRWTAALNCTDSYKVSWFVGGTANVTSQTKLILVNSGLSDAIVDVTSFSENGPTASVPVTVKPSSEKAIRVDSFNPGANKIVLKVETRSGRVVSYMLDERVRGLNNLGADFVAPIYKPETNLTIAGMPVKSSVNRVKQTLRIMTTGQIDGSASIEVVSPEGVFIPVGFGNISLQPQKVKDLDLSQLDLGGKTFGLRISSSAPVVASVLTEVDGTVSDFMWSAPSVSFGNISFNLYGLEPTMTFVGKRILVNVEWRNNRGRSFSKTLLGEEVLNWKVPANVRLIYIFNQSGVRAGMHWFSRDGITHLPLMVGTNIESATRPIADIAVIQSRN